MPATAPTHIEPLLVGVDDVTRITGLCKSTIYKLVRSGELRPAKHGAKTVFAYAEVRDFAANVLAQRDQSEQHAAARSAEAARRRSLRNA